MSELPTIDGWRLAVRKGRRGGYVGKATRHDREIATHEHMGKGARDRAVQDITVLVDVERALEAEPPGSGRVPCKLYASGSPDGPHHYIGVRMLHPRRGT